MNIWPFKKKAKQELIPRQFDHTERALDRARDHCSKHGYRFAAVIGYKDENGARKPEMCIFVIDKKLNIHKFAAGLRQLAQSIEGKQGREV